MERMIFVTAAVPGFLEGLSGAEKGRRDLGLARTRTQTQKCLLCLLKSRAVPP
jgi:hypothetical protein